MACVTGAVECSLEKLERFLTDYKELTAITRRANVTNEHLFREKFNEMPHKKEEKEDYYDTNYY